MASQSKFQSPNLSPRHVTAFYLATLIVSGMISCSASVAQNSSDSKSPLREYQGVVEPIRKFVFSARFDGLLSKINFKQGQIVKNGDIVFEFMPTAKQLNLEMKRAQRKRAEAELRGAEKTLRRYQILGKTNAVPTARIDDAEVSRDIASAKLDEARSAERTAELIVANMQLRAPFTGSMSPPFVPEGTFMDLDSRTSRPLAEIVQLDPIRVVGKVPYGVFLERRGALMDDQAAMRQANWSLILPDGEIYPHTGHPTSGDYEVDRTTQTIDVWAEFPNPDFLLRPGLKVTIQSRIGSKN